RALDLALAGRPLDFCCVCTPLAPFLGGAGSHAASAAGLFADAFVTERRGRSAVPWQNIVWDAWVKDGGTVRDSTAPDRTATDNAPKDRENDRHAMTAKDGVEVLRRALVAAEERQLVISTVALEPRLDSWLRGRSVLPLAEPPEPDEAASRPQLEADYVAPRNATEEAIVDLWSELLGFEQLGVDDNFFELGGDSLLATRLLSRLRQRFSAPLSLPAFFKAPTVAALAMEIAAHHLPAPPVEGAATSPIDEEEVLL
ncbi:MAG: phosphopantetheine-binding protein, partial [Acidobacteriota bacterium]